MLKHPSTTATNPPRHPFFHPLMGAQAFPLMRTVRRHGGVSLRDCHRLCLALGLALVRLPNCAVEAIRAAPAAKWTCEQPPIFIVGHWRSGTTLLHNLISRDPAFCYPTLFEVLSPYEFFPSVLERYTLPLLWRQVPPTRPMDDVPLRPDLPQEEEIAIAAMAAPSFLNCLYFPREMSRIFAEEVLFAGDDTRNLREWQRVYRYFLGKLSLRYPGKRLLLKNPANSARVRHLRAMFPGAKFIHVHREPLDVFRSTRTFYHRMLTAVALQDHDEAHVTTHIAWAYERLMHILLSDLASLPAQDVIDMPYARLVAEPLQSVEHVYAGLGLELGPDVRADMDRFVRDTTVIPAPAPRMTADVADDLCARWKPIFDALGYPCGGSGADP